MRNKPETGPGWVGLKLTVRVALPPAARVSGAKGTWVKVNPAPETSMLAIVPIAFPVFLTRTTTVPGAVGDTGVSGRVIVWPGKIALAEDAPSTSYENAGPMLEASTPNMTERSTKSMRT